MKEIFKNVKGYEGLYQISNLGRVTKFCEMDRSTGKNIKRSAGIKGGYLECIYLFKIKKAKKIYYDIKVA